MISHWDDVTFTLRERGHIAAEWASLTGDASLTCGVKRVRIHPGRWSTPAHVEGSEEEIVYVLAGSGISWQDGECYEVRTGDCIVHLAGAEVHTLLAGEDGLDVLMFGERHAPMGTTRLPRAGVSSGIGTWTLAHGDSDHSWQLEWELEADAGPPEVSAPSERPARIVNVADVPAEPFGHGDVESSAHDFGMAAGSVRTGLNQVVVPPGKLNVPPHCHSAEEELFVVLAGGGELELTPTPNAWPDAVTGSFPVRAGTTVVRRAASRVAHTFRAGPGGMTLLSYGTRDPNDIAYYPRSRKLNIRGIGVTFPVDSIGYWEGEG